jgi:hypothetical protein
MQGQAESLAKNTMRKYRQMLRHRDGMRTVWRLLSKYIFMRDLWSGDSSLPSRSVKLSVAGVSSDAAVDAARTAATAFGGALWPNVDDSFELVPHPLMRYSPDQEPAVNSEECKTYYAEATRRVRVPFGSPEARFLVSLGEHFDEQVVFGTSGILGEEKEYDETNPVCFRSISIETCVIDEGPDGGVDTYAFEDDLTVRQVVEKYGGNVSKEVAEKYKTPEGQDEFIKVLHVIRPRGDHEIPAGVDTKEKQFKKIASIHLEAATEHILKNDGMDENSAFMVRFRKRPGERYGRSLGMDALPIIKSLNVLDKAVDLATGKQLDPPVGFHVESLGGAGTVDLSMGAKVPIYNTGLIPQGRPVVEQLMQVPEPRVAAERVQSKEDRIQQKFLVDRLLDFNNKTRMTAKESEIRMDFRNQALGNLFARQITELFYPLILWVVSVFWRRGMLGFHPVKDTVMIQLMQYAGQTPFVMPDVVAQFYDRTGKVPFVPRFTSPAARAMGADALFGLEKLTNYGAALATMGLPEALDRLDADEAMELYQYHIGAPSKAVRSREAAGKIRKARQQAQQEMAQLQSAEQQSQIGKNAAKAAKDAAQAGINPAGALGLGA